MSDTSNDSGGRDKGLHIDKNGFHCIPCRCKRQFYHKETKTVKENNIVITDTVIDKRNIKIGGMVDIQARTIFLKMNIHYRQEALKYAIQAGVNHRLPQKNLKKD